MFFHRLFLTDNDDADFEYGRLGMWSNSKSDNLDWKFYRSYTLTINTGLSADHTTGLGLYFCIASIMQENMYKLNKIRPLASTGDTLFDLLKSSDHTQTHLIIGK